MTRAVRATTTAIPALLRTSTLCSPLTAKVYTDLSLFTCSPPFTRDAAKMFNYMTGASRSSLSMPRVLDCGGRRCETWGNTNTVDASQRCVTSPSTPRLAGYATPSRLERVAVAPITLRTTLESYIRAETEAARAGRPSGIWAKMNALVDPPIIDLLYNASQARRVD